MYQNKYCRAFARVGDFDASKQPAQKPSEANHTTQEHKEPEQDDGEALREASGHACNSTKVKELLQKADMKDFIDAQDVSSFRPLTLESSRAHLISPRSTLVDRAQATRRYT